MHPHGSQPYANKVTDLDDSDVYLGQGWIRSLLVEDEQRVRSRCVLRAEHWQIHQSKKQVEQQGSQQK